MTGPVGSMTEALLRNMSMANETSVVITDAQRESLLRSVFDTFYSDVSDGHVVFDTNRTWCSKLPLIASLFPAARVICCVRPVPEILDSIERLIRQNKFQPSGIFNFEPTGNVYSRVDGLTGAGGLVAYAWNSTREAFCGEHSDKLLAVTYQTLTTDPQRVLDTIYKFIDEPPFTHDFNKVEFDAAEFDRRLGTPGLHKVARQVVNKPRKSILPPELIQKFANDSFWLDPARNPNNVPVI
jgi:sulfotransferase